ncbi:hypothetical protein P389DRAFT_192453 [Cystobasidium minutum MCA 4210]|uniref:uncharacterized protein n=1 Tax=Cystobasidium minutum MCA 4210 TaxID=1397322 RepID=UPI0034CD5946|eukprot:jgi/Rhomi1/192453/gm1.667_g
MTSFRVDLFLGLPTELQDNILQKLDSHEHLLAFSTISRHLRTLVLPLIYSRVDLTSLVPTASVQAFASLCAPLHGRYCRDLNLAFSFKPMLNEEDDQCRAKLFAEILGRCSSNLRSLIFDAAGSSLTDCKATLNAIASGSFSKLRHLDVRCYDPEQDEVTCLANVFNSLACRPSSMPQLQSLALQGEWALSSDRPWQDEIDTSPVFHGLSALLRSRPKITNLRLSHLNVEARDLKKLMTDTTALEKLTLDRLDNFCLQDCLQSLIETPAQYSLKDLTLHMDYQMIPAGNLYFSSKKEHKFPSLQSLELTRNQGQRTGSTSDLSVFALYGSLFRCSQLTFPSLEKVNIDEAFSFTLGTAKTLATHILKARKIAMPSLREIICGETAAQSNVNVIEPYLEKCGIKLTRVGYVKEDQIFDRASGGLHDRSVGSCVATMNLED